MIIEMSEEPKEVANGLHDYLNRRDRAGYALPELSFGHGVQIYRSGTLEIAIRIDEYEIGEIELTADQALLLACQLTNAVRNHGLK
jgi:hypothetical protein